METGRCSEQNRMDQLVGAQAVLDKKGTVQL